MHQLLMLSLSCYFSITSTIPSPVVEDMFTPPASAHYSPTSEYLIGSVAVGIVAIESNGDVDTSSEDWTNDELDTVVAEVTDALAWWKARDSRANLTFSVTLTQIGSSYEPIARPRTDENLWVQEVMARLGCSETSYFESVRCANDALREAQGTDWAVTLFVIDSSNDADGRFSDEMFAYAYVGGPFAVLTYDVADYGSQNMDAVAAHEIGHIFYALDQYYAARVPCTVRSGILNVENQNSEYGNCLSDVPSIMRGYVQPFSTGALDWYARGQIGWRDSDCDGILDPVDDDGQWECPRIFLPVVQQDTTRRGSASKRRGGTDAK